MSIDLNGLQEVGVQPGEEGRGVFLTIRNATSGSTLAEATFREPVQLTVGSINRVADRVAEPCWKDDVKLQKPSLGEMGDDRLLDLQSVIRLESLPWNFSGRSAKVGFTLTPSGKEQTFVLLCLGSEQRESELSAEIEDGGDRILTAHSVSRPMVTAPVELKFVECVSGTIQLRGKEERWTQDNNSAPRTVNISTTQVRLEKASINSDNLIEVSITGLSDGIMVDSRQTARTLIEDALDSSNPNKGLFGFGVVLLLFIGAIWLTRAVTILATLVLPDVPKDAREVVTNGFTEEKPPSK